MALTVDEYKQLTPSEQKKALKDIKNKLTKINKEMDNEFEDYLKNKMANKIISLNKLGHKIPTLFIESVSITLNTSSNNDISPPTKKRKIMNRINNNLISHNTDNDSDIDSDNDDNNDIDALYNRTITNLNILKTNVVINDSISSIQDLICDEIIYITDMISMMKMSISLRIPAIQPGDNFGVHIQEDIVDDLSRAESGALDATEQLATYYQIRSKLISKILKFPNINDYRYAFKEFDKSHLSILKSMIFDLRNSYLILYDTITKNIEKLKKPRENASRCYY